jgi:hypothetical protein
MILIYIPGLQTQVNAFGPNWLQIPLTHGLDAHTAISVPQLIPVYPLELK